MTTASFNVTKVESEQIRAILARYQANRREHKLPSLTGEELLSCEMDLTACHANGCPLDLERMLSGRPFDLAHDIAGISIHIDRTTGKLAGHFQPRFAR
jgi:hypothetical protein